MLKARVAVFVSGGGTNLQALLDADMPHADIVLVLSNREDAYALQRARAAGVDAFALPRGRAAFEREALPLLSRYRIDAVVLAGFLSILSENFLRSFPERVVNVHPSLIPSFCGKGYYGLRVHEAALAYGVKVTGATVHLVNEVPDGGRILRQKAVEVREDPVPFVSRGGLKLQKALGVFGIDLTGAYALDVGASTGGFTRCLLDRGAGHVYALDVGHGQLHPSLREDSRVTALEGVNARTMTPGLFPVPPDMAVMDVSFISQSLIYPALAAVLRPGSRLVTLVKPQFEAGREKVGKKGVVRDGAVHREVLENFLGHAKAAGFTVLDLSYSPIRGPEGNIEYLGYLALDAGEERSFDLAALVEASHAELEKEGGPV